MACHMYVYANHNFSYSYLCLMNFIILYLILSNPTFVITLLSVFFMYIDRVVYVRFEKSEYRVTEEDKAKVEVTVLTDRPVSRSFSVLLRSEHNSTQGESCSHALC